MRKAKCILIGAVGLAALFIQTSQGADRARGREAVAERQTVPAKMFQFLTGSATFEETADSLIVYVGDARPFNTFEFDLRFDDATVKVRAADLDLVLMKLTGIAQIDYWRGIWTLYIEDTLTGQPFEARFVRRVSDDPQVEQAYAEEIERFFASLENPAPVLAGVIGGVAWGTCPTSYECCKAGTCEAQCPSGKSAVCSSNANGCTARCRAVMA